MAAPCNYRRRHIDRQPVIWLLFTTLFYCNIIFIIAFMSLTSYSPSLLVSAA